MADNETRAAHASIARDAYLAAKREHDDRDGTLIDMIADVLHLARSEGYDTARVVRSAQANYSAEAGV